jgi:hypothetical protein
MVALSKPAYIVETRLRTGKHDDIPAIARLMDRANAADRIPRIDEHELEAVADRGQLIVLQLEPDEVAAAACVATGRGLVFLVIDPDLASPELERRMIGVADALCESERSSSRRGRGRR